MGTSAAVKSALPADYNMKRQINLYRKKARGHPASSATCAQDVQIPLSGPDHSDGGLYVLDDVTTSRGKRVVAFTSPACKAALNQPHKVVYIDGTFKTSPKHFKQIWIIRGYVGNTVVPLMYFLIEDKSGVSYSKLSGYVDNELMRSDLHAVYGLFKH